LREAQASALKLAKTGMAVTLDIATVNNIHPPFKTEVGERLALLALNNDYGKKVLSLARFINQWLLPEAQLNWYLTMLETVWLQRTTS